MSFVVAGALGIALIVVAVISIARGLKQARLMESLKEMSNVLRDFEQGKITQAEFEQWLKNNGYPF